MHPTHSQHADPAPFAAAPTLEQTRAYFDARAEGWDKSCPHNPRKLAAIVALAAPKPGARILDIACGTGALFPALLNAQPAEILGVDLSPGMIAVAARKFSDPRIRLLAGDVHALGPEEGGFDLAFVYSAYPHFPERERLLRKAHALLRPGGRLMIAHSESRATINGRHGGSARGVSTLLRPVHEEAALLAPFFTVDIRADTDEFFLLSGTRA